MTRKKSKPNGKPGRGPGRPPKATPRVRPSRAKRPAPVLPITGPTGVLEMANPDAGRAVLGQGGITPAPAEEQPMTEEPTAEPTPEEPPKTVTVKALQDHTVGDREYKAGDTYEIAAALLDTIVMQGKAKPVDPNAPPEPAPET